MRFGPRFDDQRVARLVQGSNCNFADLYAESVAFVSRRNF